MVLLQAVRTANGGGVRDPTETGPRDALELGRTFVDQFNAIYKRLYYRKPVSPTRNARIRYTPEMMEIVESTLHRPDVHLGHKKGFNMAVLDEVAEELSTMSGMEVNAQRLKEKMERMKYPAQAHISKGRVTAPTVLASFPNRYTEMPAVDEGKRPDGAMNLSARQQDMLWRNNRKGKRIKLADGMKT